LPRKKFDPIFEKRGKISPTRGKKKPCGNAAGEKKTSDPKGFSRGGRGGDDWDLEGGGGKVSPQKNLLCRKENVAKKKGERGEGKE